MFLISTFFCEIVLGLSKSNVFTLKVVVGVPGCYLQYVVDKLPNNIGVAAQNCYKAAKGAFTGELAPAMIQVFSFQL